MRAPSQWMPAVVVTFLAHHAMAQDPSSAAPLFDRGLEDMLAGRYETGCPSLAESHRLEPRPGTLFTVAECFAKWGKVATAFRYYEQYLSVFAQMPPEPLDAPASPCRWVAR